MQQVGFSEYANAWAKAEAYQGKIMIGTGIFIAIAFVAIFRSENELLRGALLPLSLLLAILLGYGSFIIYSRAAHARDIIRLYQKSSEEAVEQEIIKHENDNRAGKLLIQIYPILMLAAVIALFVVPSSYYKGMTLGFLLLFIAAFVIDNGFVSRSDAFLSFLENSVFDRKPAPVKY